MTKYLYNGAFSIEKIDNKEIAFKKGNTYDLNAENQRVKTLVKLKKLTEIKTKKETKTADILNVNGVNIEKGQK